MNTTKLAIAADHAGFELKQEMVKYLQKKGIEVKDFGTFSPNSVDYADFAHPLANAVEGGEFPVGISICGSGNGISMTVNKHQGIRSAICWMPEIAMLARLHSDANVCALPARYITDEQAIEIVNVFLTTDFEGGRHINRINKIPC